MAMAALPYIIAAVAAAVSAASDYMSDSAQINAQIDAEKYNRDLLRRQAGNEALIASMAEDAQRREAAFVQARTRAGLIEAGIGTARGGSAVAVSGQAAKFAELDALNIRWEGNARRTALLSQADLVQYGIEGLRGQRAAARTSAVLEGIKGVASAWAGGMGAGTDVLQKAKTGTVPGGVSKLQGSGRTTYGLGRDYNQPAAMARDVRGPVFGRRRYYQPAAVSSQPRLG